VLDDPSKGLCTLEGCLPRPGLPQVESLQGFSSCRATACFYAGERLGCPRCCPRSALGCCRPAASSSRCVPTGHSPARPR
jgi:hypothetical protein